MPRGWLGLSIAVAWKPCTGSKVVGVSNRIGARYCPFFDYDQDVPQLLIAEIRDLQDRFLLGDAFFFKTGRGYHVIIPELLPLFEWTEILKASTVEAAYAHLPQINKSRAWVLRVTPKGNNRCEYAGCVPGINGRETSRDMIQHLTLRGVPEEDLREAKHFMQEQEYGLTYATYEA
jgi:hypothetical protein